MTLKERNLMNSGGTIMIIEPGGGDIDFFGVALCLPFTVISLTSLAGFRETSMTFGIHRRDMSTKPSTDILNKATPIMPSKAFSQGASSCCIAPSAS